VWVSEDDYVAPTGRTAIFKLQDYHDQIFDQVTAILRGDSSTTLKKNALCGGIDINYSCPVYEVATAGGVTEVFEQRGALIRVNDDPRVRAELGVTP
jgi:hypothetical protein